MPVTFTVATHKTNRVESKNVARSPRGLLEQSWGRLNKDVKSVELLQSSMGSGKEPAILNKTLASRNGSVDTIISAYSNHHRLIIRPDDVWIAIPGQFNFYVNAHAEELRSSFVAHEGKKDIVVNAVGNRYTVDFGRMAKQMTDGMDQNLVDKDLKDWILPNFTTTTHNDTVICSILMMSTLKAFFSYYGNMICGIPAITLEGEKEDYQKILARLDKLSTFGPEPELWVKMLRPIMSQFVSAFDKPDIDFWSRICVYDAGCGAPFISGWITAFCVWSATGDWMGPRLPSPPADEDDEYYGPIDTRDPSPRSYVLDGIEYPWMATSDVPIGFCDVEVKLNDNGVELDCLMVAGHLASTIEGNKTLRPSPAWFIFLKK